MKTLFINKQLPYTGAELSSLFAYKNFSLQGNSVIGFIGPCHVDQHLVDQEDVKNEDFIKSKLMVHFIAEIFQLDLAEGIFRQRLYMSIVKEIVEKKVAQIRRSGDDLFIGKRKLSVSIATLSPVSTMIHIGINVDPTGAPVPAIGLAELKINPKTFAQEVLQAIAREEESIDLARCKVRGVQ
jgi:hypothetical protein